MPLPYRWLTAMMARCDGSSLLIDCGEGTQVALKEKGWSPKPIGDGEVRSGNDKICCRRRVCLIRWI